MPSRDQYLLVVGGVAMVGAAIASISLPWFAVIPFAAAAAALFAAAFLDSARAPRVLLVGPAELGGMASLESALTGAGCAVSRCPGPATRECPALSDETCPYGDSLVSVVVVDSERWPAAPCGDALGISELRLPGANLAHPLQRIEAMKSAKAFVAA